MTPTGLNLVNHLSKVVAFRSLKRRECLQRLKPSEPELLTNRQHIPIVDESGARRIKASAETHGGVHLQPDRLFKRIPLDVVDKSEMKGDKRQKPAVRSRLRHRVVHLPILVPHRGRGGTREIVEHVS